MTSRTPRGAMRMAPLLALMLALMLALGAVRAVALSSIGPTTGPAGFGFTVISDACLPGDGEGAQVQGLVDGSARVSWAGDIADGSRLLYATATDAATGAHTLGLRCVVSGPGGSRVAWTSDTLTYTVSGPARATQVAEATVPSGGTVRVLTGAPLGPAPCPRLTSSDQVSIRVTGRAGGNITISRDVDANPSGFNVSVPADQAVGSLLTLTATCVGMGPGGGLVMVATTTLAHLPVQVRVTEAPEVPAPYGRCPYGPRRAGDLNCDNQVDVAILGDSYISGEGAGDYRAVGACHQSEHSWAYRSVEGFADNILFLACSGAKTEDLRRGGDLQLPQIALLRASGGVDIVLVSVGGNDLGTDAGLSEAIKDCTLADCAAPARKRHWLDRAAAAEAKITATLNEIKQAGTRDGVEPLVILSGLPNPADPADSCRAELTRNDDGSYAVAVGDEADPEGAFGFSASECRFITRELLPRLTGAQESAADQAGVVFEGRPLGWLAGHGAFAGNGDEWFHAYRNWPGNLPILRTFLEVQESFHPNRTGWDRWADAFTAAWVASGRIFTERNPDPAPPLPSPADGGYIRAISGPDGRVVAWSSNVSATLSDLPDGTQVVVANFSLPTEAARLTVRGDTRLDFRVPVGTAPGEHRLEAWTTDGRYLGAVPYRVMAPAGCTDGPDADRDGLEDGCDPSPVDGPAADADRDGLANEADNCPTIPNPGQEPGPWGPETGAHCALAATPPMLAGDLGDIDSDGVADDADNCPVLANPDQADGDRDGTGDACKPAPAPVLPGAGAPAAGGGQPASSPAPAPGAGAGAVRPRARVAIRQPACARRSSARACRSLRLRARSWRILRGTATGVSSVQVAALLRTRTGSCRVLAGRRQARTARCLAGARGAVRVRVVRGRWSVRLAGVAPGRVSVRVRAGTAAARLTRTLR